MAGNKKALWAFRRRAGAIIELRFQGPKEEAVLAMVVVRVRDIRDYGPHDCGGPRGT